MSTYYVTFYFLNGQNQLIIQCFFCAVTFEVLKTRVKEINAYTREHFEPIRCDLNMYCAEAVEVAKDPLVFHNFRPE